MSIEAMKEAVEALENKRHEYRAYQAITALRQAIEQAEKQEPVAWVCEGFGKEKHNLDYVQDDIDALPVGTPLYTAPPQTEKQEPYMWARKNYNEGSWTRHEPPNDPENWISLYTAPPRKEWVGLTDEEIDKAIISTAPSFKPDDVARAIEAKLKEKNV